MAQRAQGHHALVNSTIAPAVNGCAGQFYGVALMVGRAAIRRVTGDRATCEQVALGYHLDMVAALTPNQRLLRGQQAVNSKNYAAAWVDYRWYFEQARPADPSLAGARTQFDIYLWHELGVAFRPALVALLTWRDQCRDQVLAGAAGTVLTPGQVDAFGDMAIVNKQVQDFASTYQVFRNLHERGHAVPERCVHLALPAVIECQDYELARRYVLDPAAAVAKAVRFVNAMPHRVSSKSGAERKAVRVATLSYCSNELQPILTMVRHTEGVVAAYDLLHRAVDDILDPRLRLKVRRLLHA